ncbi:MAG TPA: chorismate mutase [Verrucomicrobia bacterium]|nr:MAG: chorismate mutase [Lentisphaerae bacterium GWF2_57_35]HBA82483.1 chorismate mutase [Verrucomicrobiota bacterium]
MDKQLLLTSTRNVLMRLEETIIFGLIERAQFASNQVIYQKGAFGSELSGESLVGYLLHETEQIHARMRRYTSPDEHPFFTDLPAPILPALVFSESPIQPNAVNINAEIRSVYEQQLVPLICPPGDDGQYGSSSVSDVMLLQALSKRIHYGKFVAESKYRDREEVLKPLIQAMDREALAKAITDEAVEAQVLERVRLKAQTYGHQLGGGQNEFRVTPEVVQRIYAEWIIPLNKQVQLEYLFQRSV